MVELQNSICLRHTSTTQLTLGSSICSILFVLVPCFASTGSAAILKAHVEAGYISSCSVVLFECLNITVSTVIIYNQSLRSI